MLVSKKGRKDPAHETGSFLSSGEAVCVRCYAQLSLKLIGPPDRVGSPDGFGLVPAPVACHGPPLVLATTSDPFPRRRARNECVGTPASDSSFLSLAVWTDAFYLHVRLGARTPGNFQTRLPEGTGHAPSLSSGIGCAA